MSDALVDDLEWFDGLEAVELTIGVNTHNVQALRRPLTARLDDDTPIERAAWHVRKADLEDDVPSVGNTLTAGAEQWLVKEVERLSFGTRFRLVCEL